MEQNHFESSIYSREKVGQSPILFGSGIKQHIHQISTLTVRSECFFFFSAFRQKVFWRKPVKSACPISYTHRLYQSSLTETVCVAGTFNDWKPQANGYKMTFDGDRNFRLEIPWSELDRSDQIAFKFVVNGSEWYGAPPSPAR